MYQVLGKTRNVVLKVDSGGFSVLSTKFVPGNWSPFPLIIPWETMKVTGLGRSEVEPRQARGGWDAHDCFHITSKNVLLGRFCCRNV